MHHAANGTMGFVGQRPNSELLIGRESMSLSHRLCLSRVKRTILELTAEQQQLGRHWRGAYQSQLMLRQLRLYSDQRFSGNTYPIKGSLTNLE